MLGVGFHHHESDAVAHRDGFESVAAEIALHKRTGLAVHRRGLIEQSARAASEGMLRLLTDLGELGLVIGGAVNLLQRKRRGHFKSGGRAQTSAERDIAAEDRLEALARLRRVTREEPREGAERIVRPGRSGLDLLDVRKPALPGLARSADVGREDLNGVVGGRGDREERALVDGSGEDIALVVVGVIAEHLDAAGSIAHHRGLRAVKRLELRNDLVVHFLVQHGVYPLFNFYLSLQLSHLTISSMFFGGFDRNAE